MVSETQALRNHYFSCFFSKTKTCHSSPKAFIIETSHQGHTRWKIITNIDIKRVWTGGDEQWVQINGQEDMGDFLFRIKIPLQNTTIEAD